MEATLTRQMMWLSALRILARTTAYLIEVSGLLVGWLVGWGLTALSHKHGNIAPSLKVSSHRQLL